MNMSCAHWNGILKIFLEIFPKETYKLRKKIQNCWETIVIVEILNAINNLRKLWCRLTATAEFQQSSCTSSVGKANLFWWTVICKGTVSRNRGIDRSFCTSLVPKGKAPLVSWFFILLHFVLICGTIYRRNTRQGIRKNILRHINFAILSKIKEKARSVAKTVLKFKQLQWSGRCNPF